MEFLEHFEAHLVSEGVKHIAEAVPAVISFPCLLETLHPATVYRHCYRDRETVFFDKLRLRFEMWLGLEFQLESVIRAIASLLELLTELEDITFISTLLNDLMNKELKSELKIDHGG